MFLFAVCRALNIPYFFIHANFIYGKFQIQSCEIPFENFWQLMTFDILQSFFKTFILCGFSQHAFECGETKSIEFYLLLVIDCEKLISKEGCQPPAKKNPNLYFSPTRKKIHRTNRIIVNKKLFFLRTPKNM